MKPTVVFQTDFGAGGGGVLAGVVKSIDPEVPVYDFTHDIEPYNIRQAGYEISTMVPYWPAGTVFVSVVDPGVGKHSRQCVCKFKNGSYLVTPDNGILTPFVDDGSIECIRNIDITRHRLPGSENVYIFHGRDVYAYTAGKLAAGVISFEDVGEAYDASEAVYLPQTNVKTVVREGFAQGGIYNFDTPYGCARVRIRNKDFQEVAGFRYGDIVHVKITDGDRIVLDDKATYERSFGFAPRHKPLICGDIQIGEAQMLRFTINDANFMKEYAPELLDDQSKAVDYVFTVTKE